MNEIQENSLTPLTEEERLLRHIFGESETEFKNATPLTPEKRAELMAGLKEKLKEVLTVLTERERKVFELRFGILGIGDGHRRTLEEVGQQFRVPRERIRQIETKALRKMKHRARIKVLKDISDPAKPEK